MKSEKDLIREYWKKATQKSRENKKVFTAVVDIELMEKLEKHLKVKRLTKKQWLVDQIEKIK